MGWSEVTMAEDKSVEEYVAWIMNSSSWGGFVDLIVLSECYQIQISVISTESLYWTHYPADESVFNRRIYLLYDGIHYDAIVGQTSDGGEARFQSVGRGDHAESRRDGLRIAAVRRRLARLPLRLRGLRRAASRRVRAEPP